MIQISRRKFLQLGTSAAISSLLLRNSNAFAEVPGTWFQSCRPLMGSFATLAVFDTDSKRARQVLDTAFSLMSSFATEFSHFTDSGFLHDLNVKRVVATQSAPASFLELVELSSQLHQLSQGSFCIWSGALSNLWRQCKLQRSLPDRKDIRHATEQVATSQLVCSPMNIQLLGESSLDLGGVAKGLISDLGAQALQRAGAKFGRVDCGGDIRFLGDTNWIIDIEHPRRKDILGSVSFSGSLAIATSGDYRECWTVNSKRYHHLIDARTGRPAEHMQSVSVISTSAMLADALASALFFLSREHQAQLLSKFQQTAAVVASDNTSIYTLGELQFIPKERISGV